MKKLLLALFMLFTTAAMAADPIPTAVLSYPNDGVYYGHKTPVSYTISAASASYTFEISCVYATGTVQSITSGTITNSENISREYKNFIPTDTGAARLHIKLLPYNIEDSTTIISVSKLTLTTFDIPDTVWYKQTFNIKTLAVQNQTPESRSLVLKYFTVDSGWVYLDSVGYSWNSEFSDLAIWSYSDSIKFGVFYQSGLLIQESKYVPIKHGYITKDFSPVHSSGIFATGEKITVTIHRFHLDNIDIRVTDQFSPENSTDYKSTTSIGIARDQSVFEYTIPAASYIPIAGSKKANFRIYFKENRTDHDFYGAWEFKVVEKYAALTSLAIPKEVETGSSVALGWLCSSYFPKAVISVSIDSGTTYSIIEGGNEFQNQPTADAARLSGSINNIFIKPEWITNNAIFKITLKNETDELAIYSNRFKVVEEGCEKARTRLTKEVDDLKADTTRLNRIIFEKNRRIDQLEREKKDTLITIIVDTTRLLTGVNYNEFNTYDLNTKIVGPAGVYIYTILGELVAKIGVEVNEDKMIVAKLNELNDKVLLIIVIKSDGTFSKFKYLK